MNSGAGQRLVIAGDLDPGLVRAERRGGDCRHAASQRADDRAVVWVHAVGEQYDIRLADWIDPHRGPGEAGVAIRTDREKLTTVGRKGGVDIPAQASGSADREAIAAW